VKPVTTLVLASLLAGCGGPRPETLLYELRVVAAVAEPPEVAVGETYQLTATIADPLDEGGDWMMWSCLPEVGCAVEQGALGVDDPSVPVPAVAPVPVWIMACAPGACDLAAATDAQLEDPEAWMRDLPLSGVTLASRLTRLTDAPVGQRNTNPVIDTAPEAGWADGVQPDEERALSFVVPGAETAYGYTTAGGFTMTEFDVGDAGNTELTWVAPEKGGEATLYVVFDDGLGGTVVWQDTVVVER